MFIIPKNYPQIQFCFFAKLSLQSNQKIVNFQFQQNKLFLKKIINKSPSKNIRNEENEK